MQRLVYTDAWVEGAIESRVTSQLDEARHVDVGEATSLHSDEVDLMSKGGIITFDLILPAAKKSLFIMHVHNDTPYLHIQPCDLLLHMLHLEVWIWCQSTGRFGPRFCGDIFTSVMEEVKVCEKRVLNNILLREKGLFGGHGGGGIIVAVEGSADGLRPCTKGLCNVFT